MTQDTIDLSSYGIEDYATLRDQMADDANGNAVITLSDGESITLEGVSVDDLGPGNFFGYEVIIGTEFEDNTIGSQISDEIHALESDDIIDGQAGDDDIYGDEGNDTLIGGAGDDTLRGGEGNDTADYSDTTEDRKSVV